MAFKLASAALNFVLLALLAVAVLTLRSAGRQLGDLQSGLDRANEYIGRLQDQKADLENDNLHVNAMLAQCQGLMLNREKQGEVAPAHETMLKAETILPPPPQSDLGARLLKFALQYLF